MMKNERQHERQSPTFWTGSLRGSHGVLRATVGGSEIGKHSVDNTPLLCWDAAGIEVGDPLVYCEQGTGLKMVLLYALNSSP